jgi:glycerol-3-phosphate acyltransferase PlsY
VNIALFALAVAYLAGAIPFGYLVVRLTAGADVRRAGSGNIGATNVMRTTGVAAGVATLALDAAKGWFAVWFMDWATGGEPIWLAMGALAAMAGHAFPVFLKFRGGKAVATFFFSGPGYTSRPFPPAPFLSFWSSPSFTAGTYPWARWPRLPRSPSAFG